MNIKNFGAATYRVGLGQLNSQGGASFWQGPLPLNETLTVHYWMILFLALVKSFPKELEHFMIQQWRQYM